MNSSRRSFIGKAALVTEAAGIGFSCSDGRPVPAAVNDGAPKKFRRNRIGVSTYSTWQFNGRKENSPLGTRPDSCRCSENGVKA